MTEDPVVKSILNIRYSSESFDGTYTSDEHQLTADGIFLPTPRPLERSRVLCFHLTADDGASLQGVVMVKSKRSPAQATPGKPPGMFIKFVHFDDADAARALLDTLRAREMCPSRPPSGIRRIAPRPATPTPSPGIYRLVHGAGARRRAGHGA